jgi:hypothetical protein
MVDVPPALALVPAALLAFASTSAAWRCALETRDASVPLTRTTHPLPALAMVHVLALARVARARVVVAAMLAAIGGVALRLSLQNDPPSRPVARALTIFALPLSIAASVLVTPALASEARLRPLLRATRTPGAVLLFALALAIGAPSSALGATSSALAASLAGGSAWPIAGAVAAWAAPLALAIAAWARRHDATARRDPMLFVMGVLAIGAAATWVASW